MLEDFNGPGGKEPLVIYNSYLRFCCFALLEINSYILFTITNIKNLASVLVGAIVNPKDLK